jgi:hypothetical protein
MRAVVEACPRLQAAGYGALTGSAYRQSWRPAWLRRSAGSRPTPTSEWRSRVPSGAALLSGSPGCRRTNVHGPGPHDPDADREAQPGHIRDELRIGPRGRQSGLVPEAGGT